MNINDRNKVKQALEEVASLMDRDESLQKDYSNDDLRVLYTLAYTLYQGNDYEQAKTIFQQLASSKPFVKKYWLGLGACWQMEKSYSEALKAWGMSVLLDEIDPIPHYHAAECYFALNEINEGFKAIQATKSRLNEQHAELIKKVENLESNWKPEEKQEA